MTIEYFEEVLLTQEQIEKRVRELAEQISRDYRDGELILVGVLRGAVIFLADLVRWITLDVKVDFIDVSSYGYQTETSGIVKIEQDISLDVEGKDVLLVEDIIDTGLTWSYLREYFQSKNPRTLKICSLLDKPSRRRVEIYGDYVGFTIPDRFVMGYGLDCCGFFRNLTAIGTPSQEVWELTRRWNEEEQANE